MKKGVVSEVAEKGLVSAEVLRNNPLVYIGSGIDVEYALAIGGRLIVMVDPILADEKIQAELIKNIEKLISEKVKREGDKIFFDFDFGNGKEKVSVELVGKPYPLKDREAVDYSLPKNTGVIVLYASQGPGGTVRVNEEMKSRLVDGGVILEETNAISKKEGKERLIELGV